MRDDEILVQAFIRTLRGALEHGTDVSKGWVSLSRLEADADGALRAKRAYGIAPGIARSVVASLIRDGRLDGTIEADMVNVRRVRAAKPKTVTVNESSQTGWGWEK